MAATTSTLQILANRANAQHSTGPRTDAGKLSIATNALSHGLTTRNALLPTEDPVAYARHHQAYSDHYRGDTPNEIRNAAVQELADIYWRLQRVPTFEAQLLTTEFHRLKTDPELASHIKGIEDNDGQIITVAFTRLILARVLPNLFNQEARLARRADKLQRQLESGRPPIPYNRPTLQPVALDEQPRPEPEPEPAPETANEENLKIEANSTRPQPIRVTPQPGRNEPCPCNSGLKFKRCCLNHPQQ